MKRKFRKFFLWAFGLFFLLTFLAMLSASLFADRIGNLVKNELNKGLKHGITIENYDLTMLRYFPKAAVTLNGVKVPDAHNKATLLEAEELAFRFGLFSVFGSKIDISSVIVNDGALYVSYDKAGRANYDIFKPTETSGDDGGTSLNLKLEKAVMRDVELVYVDEQNRHDARINIQRADMSGEFSGERFALKSTASFETGFFETLEGRYLLGKQVEYTADVDVDLAREHYQIKDFLLNVEDNKFTVGGEVKKQGNGMMYDLSFDGQDCSLQSLLGLLPPGYMENLVGLESRGDFTFKGVIKGQSGDTQPAINVQLGLVDGKISGPQLKSPFRDLTFTATYTNGAARTSRSTVLEIKDFKGYINREMVELKLRVENMDDPSVYAIFNGSIPLDAVYDLAADPLLTGGGGDVEVNGLEIRGRVQDMVNPGRIHLVQTQGEIRFDDAMLKYNGETITIDKGKLILEGNQMSLQGVRINGLGSEINLSGKSENLIPVLMADSINSKDAQLAFDVNLDADELNLQRWLDLYPMPEEAEVTEEVYDSLKTQQISQREALSNFLNGQFRCNVERFQWGKIKGQNFNGLLQVQDKKLIVDGSVEAMDGKFELDGIIFLEKEPKLKAKLSCKGIDGRAFFRQTDNFGQDVLTYKNLKGDLDANIVINAYWDKEGDMMMDKLEVLSETRIRDGELINFGMMESFSQFVKMKDLRHIHFTDTRNWMEVKQGTFYLPVMLIQSNALNLYLSGTHTLAHDIDYNVKVNAGQVLVKKLFKKPGTKPIKARNGWFNLYYKIKGTLDDYEMESAKKEVQQEFEESEQRKKRIQNRLAEEFGVISELTQIDDMDKLADDEE